MQTIKALAIRHSEEFFHNPVGKALDLFVSALFLSLAIWLLKGAANILYHAVVS